MRMLSVFSLVLILISGSAAPTQTGFKPPEGLQQSPATKVDTLQTFFVDSHARGNSPLDQGSDNCTGITTISALPYMDGGTTAGRTNDWNTAASCAGGGGSSNAPDVIYRFVPPSTGTVVISTCGSTFNTLLELRTGGVCPGTVQTSCADAGCGGDAEIRTTVLSGLNYWIIVDGYGTQSGVYTLSVRTICDVTAQAGDLTECAETVDSSHARVDCNGGPCNALFGGTPSYTAIYCGQTYFGHGFTYTREGLPYSDTDWYRFSLSEACTVRISVQAEFPSMISAGVRLSNCADHGYTAYGNTCAPYTLTIPNVPAGDYEFTVRPWDAAGIPTARDYRVSLQCAPMSGCVVDATLTAPGTVSGNTCGAGDDCQHSIYVNGPDRMIRVVIPDEDDWTFYVTDTWAAHVALMGACCDSLIVHAFGDFPCQHLHAGEYFVNVDGDDSTSCGDFTLEVTRCRDRCCYSEPGYQTCMDTTRTACEALGGIWDHNLHCATDPCLPIPACPSNAAVSLRPYGADSWGAHGRMSDINGNTYFENFSGVENPLTHLRFWGYHTVLGGLDRCPRAPQPFHVEFRTTGPGGPGDLAASFTPTLQGWPSATHDGDTLFRFDMTLEPPVNLASGYVGIAGDVSTGCGFWWIFSPFGDDWDVAHDDSGYGTLFGRDQALCLGECVIDGEFTAPGSISGNTCGSGDDCSAEGFMDPGSEEQVFRVFIPDSDDWIFERDATWSGWIGVMGECCSQKLSGLGTRCLALAAGYYYIVVSGWDSLDCGPFTATVSRCRERCCYGDDYQLCADTSASACKVLGGMFYHERICSQPCLYVPPCTENAIISQPPFCNDQGLSYGWYAIPSDVERGSLLFENFEGVTAPISHVRFWGVTKDSLGAPCVQNPLPVSVVFCDGTYSPNDTLAAYADTLWADPVEGYGDTLFEYNIGINPPITLEAGWIGIASYGSASCDFRWRTSGIGDEEFFRIVHGTHVSFVGEDLSLCMGSCPPPDSLVLQVIGGDTMQLAFRAPMYAVYRYYYTTHVNSPFPTDYIEFYSATLAAGLQTQMIFAPPVYARFVVTTDCGTTVSRGGTTSKSSPHVARVE